MLKLSCDLSRPVGACHSPPFTTPPAHPHRAHPQKSGSWSEAKLNAYATKIVETLEKAGRNISLG
jgi:hypothetical protein